MFNFDCHAHVYEATHAIDGARYKPSRAAPLADWLNHLKKNGLEGGVIVQVSFLGFDNSEMLSALKKLDRNRFAGVAVLPVTVSDVELDELCQQGVCGVRWNLVRGAKIPDLSDPVVMRFLDKLSQRSMHLELHLESPRLAKHISGFLKTGVKIVIDHFGLPSESDPKNDPWISTARDLPDLTRLFVKFSGHYRTGFDVTPHAKALSEILPPEQIIWGSDWPHTQYENVAGFDAVADLRSTWAKSSSEVAVQSLFGISTEHAELHLSRKQM